MLNEDGTATYTFGKATRTLRRPNLAEYRELIEFLNRDSEKTTEFGTKIDKAVEWWDLVCTTLAGEGLPKKDDKVDQTKIDPALITDASMIELVVHWQTVPSLPGER